jgi:tRNA U34 5-methylaminomethyl-2-thiouridine-forming methyltransferase MnmC
VLHPHQLQKTTTDDGSITLRNLVHDALYRSSSGAKGESEHVFLHGTGLTDRAEDWRVLELGFGTGLNFLIAAASAQQLGRNLHYVAVDAAPIPPEFIPEDYPHSPLARALLQRCRDHGQPQVLGEGGVRLELHPRRWQDTRPAIKSVHAVFHDPFDPGVNPDCWTVEAFAWSRARVHATGRLATYSAAGRVRRAMRDAGYVVARAAGYGKKREMTLASPTESALVPHRIKYRP